MIDSDLLFSSTEKNDPIGGHEPRVRLWLNNAGLLFYGATYI